MKRTFIYFLTYIFIINSIPNIANARKKRNTGKKYVKISDSLLFDMVNKDYRIALNYAISVGAILSESDFFEKMQDNISKSKGLTSKEKHALIKLGIDFKPSDFIGKSRHRYLLKSGININKKQKTSGAIDILRNSAPRSKHKQKKRHIRRRKKRVKLNIFNNLSSIFISTAHAANYDEQSLDELDELYSQPSLEEAWLKSQANRQKGYKTLDGQMKQRRGIAMLTLSAGALLLTLGFINVKDGNKEILDGKNEIRKGDKNFKDGELKIGKADNKVQLAYQLDNKGLAKMELAQALMANPTTAAQGAIEMQKAQQLSMQAQKHRHEASIMRADGIALKSKGEMQRYNGSEMVSSGGMRKQTGFMMLLGGAAMIFLGMKLLGDVASMKSELKEQDKKNNQIKNARERLMKIDEQKKERKRRIIIYRKNLTN